MADGSFEVVGIENGTLQLNTTLSNFADNGIGLGNQGFDSNSVNYDLEGGVSLR